jgi:hypothetical protein
MGAKDLPATDKHGSLHREGAGLLLAQHAAIAACRP